MRYSVLGYNTNLSSRFGKIVYLELCRRGYVVCVGKVVGDCEIDFVAVRLNEKIYDEILDKIYKVVGDILNGRNGFECC